MKVSELNRLTCGEESVFFNKNTLTWCNQGFTSYPPRKAKIKQQKKAEPLGVIDFSKFPRRVQMYISDKIFWDLWYILIINQGNVCIHGQ